MKTLEVKEVLRGFPPTVDCCCCSGCGNDAVYYHGDKGRGWGGELWRAVDVSVLPRLLRRLSDGFLLFEGVDERQDSSLHTGGHPTGHRVARR